MTLEVGYNFFYTGLYYEDYLYIYDEGYYCGRDYDRDGDWRFFT